MDTIASEIGKLPGVETRTYEPAERLRPEHLRQFHVCVREGAIAFRVATGRTTPTLVEIFGANRLLSPGLLEGPPGLDGRQATALIRTTTLELPADGLDRQLGAHPGLAAALARGHADQQRAALDRLTMLAARDPFRRVAHALLLLLERLAGTSASAGARLAVGQELIAAFAGLSRQTTNRQLRRLARAGIVTLRRQAVEVREPAALLGVASGRRPPR